jgi:hypothetical protein
LQILQEMTAALAFCHRTSPLHLAPIGARHKLYDDIKRKAAPVSRGGVFASTTTTTTTT